MGEAERAKKRNPGRVKRTTRNSVREALSGLYLVVPAGLRESERRQWLLAPDEP